MGEYGDYEQGFTFRCPETGDRVHIFPRELWHEPNVPLSMRFRCKPSIPSPSPLNPPFEVYPCERIAEKYQAPILLMNHFYAKAMAQHSAPESTTGSLISGSVACKTVSSVPSSGESSSAASCRDPFHEPFHKAPRPDVTFTGYRKPSPTYSNESRLFNGFSGAYSQPESSTQHYFTQSSSRRPSRFQDLRPLSEQSSTQQSFTQQSLSQRSSTQQSFTQSSSRRPSRFQDLRPRTEQSSTQQSFTQKSFSQRSSKQQSSTQKSFSQQSATETRQSLTRQSMREASPALRQCSRPNIFVKEIDQFLMNEHGPIFEDSPSQMEENEADDSLIVRCINKLGMDWKDEVFSTTRAAVSWSWRKLNAMYRHSTREQQEAEQRRLAAEAQWRQDEDLRLSTVPESSDGASDEEPDSDSASVSSSVLRECDRRAAARGKAMAINDLKMMYMRDRAAKPLPAWEFLSDKASDYTEVTDGNDTMVSIASTFVSYIGSTVSSAASKLSGWLGFSK